mgnify:FL=1
MHLSMPVCRCACEKLLATGMQGATMPIAQLLLRLGADVDTRQNYFGQTNLETPLMESLSRMRDIRLVKLLVDAGADVNTRNDRGQTPLHVLGCSRYNSDVAVRALLMLLRAGADVSLVDNAGETPLHRVGDADIALLLLAAGVDPNHLSNDGMTALDCAAQQWRFARGHQLDVVLRAGGGVMTRQPISFYEQTPLEYVAKYDERIKEARHNILFERTRLFTERASTICMALQNMRIPALVMVAIVNAACPLALLLPLSTVYELATTVKHFHDRRAS